MQETKSIRGVFTIVAAMIFIGAFATYGANRLGISRAGTEVGCSVGSTFKVFLNDNPDNLPSSINRTVTDSLSNFTPDTQTFDINDTISIGKYEVRTISSDHHYNHRSSAPNEDVKDQPQEQYYIEIDGALTPNHSSDFTDFYDWRGGNGELLQDDDNDIDTVPQIVRDTWQGESLGVIDVNNATSQITVKHIDAITPVTPKFNSVIPSAIILECISSPQPILEVVKQVDANDDSLFNDILESTSRDASVTWSVIGRNIGDVTDPDATVFTCAPTGTTLNTSTVSAIAEGVFGSTLEVENDRCIRWSGELDPTEQVNITFDVTIDDFEACDAADGNTNGECACDAVIYSSTTSTTQADPADRDDAAVDLLAIDLTLTKAVEADQDGSFSDDREVYPLDGSEVIWQIRMGNNGPGNLVNGRMVDVFPAGVEVISASQPGIGVVSTDGNTVIWEGDMASGFFATVEVTTRIADVDAFLTCDNAGNLGNSTDDGACTNTAVFGEAGSGTTDFTGDTVQDDAEVVVVLNPDLVIKKYSEGIDEDTIFSDDVAELITAGTPFSWRVEGCNVGDADEANARIIDFAQMGVTLNPDGSTVTVVDPAGNNTVTMTDVNGKQGFVWNGAIARGDCVEITYTTTIADAGAFDMCVSASDRDCGNNATIGRATADSAISVDLTTQSSDPAYVTAMFNSILDIVKRVDANNDASFDDSIEQGTTATQVVWQIEATNTGNRDESAARIVDVLPLGVALASTDTDAMVTSEAGGATTDSVTLTTTENGNQAIEWRGALPINASVTLQIETNITSIDNYETCVTSTQGEHCRNTAVVDVHDGSDPDNTASDDADVVIEPQQDIQIIKEVDAERDGSWSEQELITLDEWFEWRITVNNTGETTLENAAVLDVFPEGVVIDEVTQTNPGSDDTLEVVAGEDNFRMFWTRPSFAPGETAEFIAVAKIVDAVSFDACDSGLVDGSQDLICTNPAFVGTGETADDFSDIDFDTAAVEIERLPSFYINKPVEGSDDDDIFTDFEQVETDATEFVWELTFGNNGLADASDVLVTDILPVGVDYASHEHDSGNGTLTYDEDTKTLTWIGDLAVDQEERILIYTSIASDEAFATCDAADGSVDDQCRNVTTLEHEDTELEDPAFVLSETAAPDVRINKLVDANADGDYSESEEISNEGQTVTWQITIDNRGDGDASSLLMRDVLRDGMDFVDGSIVEVEGADLGVAIFSDGAVEWRGDLLSGEQVVLQFNTVIADASAFTACNFSDGSPDDATCTNLASIAIEGNDGTTPIDEDTASVTTSLATVLAFTGASGISLVLFGSVVVAAALAMAIIAMRTKPNSGDSSGFGGGTPMNTAGAGGAGGSTGGPGNVILPS